MDNLTRHDDLSYNKTNKRRSQAEQVSRELIIKVTESVMVSDELTYTMQLAGLEAEDTALACLPICIRNKKEKYYNETYKTLSV